MGRQMLSSEQTKRRTNISHAQIWKVFNKLRIFIIEMRASYSFVCKCEFIIAGCYKLYACSCEDSVNVCIFFFNTFRSSLCRFFFFFCSPLVLFLFFFRSFGVCARTLFYFSISILFICLLVFTYFQLLTKKRAERQRNTYWKWIQIKRWKKCEKKRNEKEKLAIYAK